MPSLPRGSRAVRPYVSDGRNLPSSRARFSSGAAVSLPSLKARGSRAARPYVSDGWNLFDVVVATVNVLLMYRSISNPV